MSFICGSFKSQEEDDFQVLWPSPSTTSRKTRSRFCYRKNKEDKKNPYSNCGLDKFEALLAELDDKKRTIFTQKGSQHISFVRFVYSNSNDVRPLIVRLKDPRKHYHKDLQKQNNIKVMKTSSIPKSHVSTLDHHQNSEHQEDVTNGTRIITNKTHHAKASINMLSNKIWVDQWKLNLKTKLEERWMPSYNIPIFLVLVMFFLTFFGRSLVIICTSIAWYLVPKINGILENPTAKKTIKNQPSRKTIENKVISSPKTFFSEPMHIKENKKMMMLMSF
ncbi:hypothetical protein R6Q59_003024 [Mikania micrantha]|uniref:ZCF37 n=1 Tax=Mikania micrantha TaxID=192012 RepID=A0A5N6NEW1_9ASTR|nr:hypothetical protein E3N88_23358 [Mikania micrantha]